MILLTGATGYIGSHCWVELLEKDYQVLGVDNFSNSNPAVLKRIFQITGKDPIFFEGDVCVEDELSKIFDTYSIDAVIHFAALKAVGESVKKPLEYYANNVGGIQILLKVMKKHDCRNLVFSSSATVYHPDNPIPYKEGMPLGSTSPYGWSKVMCEQILRDLEVASPEISIAYLRYFNPVGAHASGLIGEDPRGIPNNLMPFVTQVAMNRRSHLSIFGDDWPTHDGTGVRDYVHVVDLVRGHVEALAYLMSGRGSITINLGAGKGYSVLDLVHAFEKVSQKSIPYKIAPRRNGDISEFYADISLAKNILGWMPKYNLIDICRDSWNWQRKNPDGYQ